MSWKRRKHKGNRLQTEIGNQHFLITLLDDTSLNIVALGKITGRRGEQRQKEKVPKGLVLWHWKTANYLMLYLLKSNVNGFKQNIVSKLRVCTRIAGALQQSVNILFPAFKKLGCSLDLSKYNTFCWSIGYGKKHHHPHKLLMIIYVSLQ